LTHLGKLSWARTIADPDTRKILLPALEGAARDVAAMHTAGVIHGDLHTANMMYQNGSHIVGDVERSVVNAQGIQLRVGEAKDIHRLGITLLLQQGFLGDRSPSFRAGALNDHLYQPYLEVRGQNGMPSEEMVAAWDDGTRTNQIFPPRRFGIE
jgi:hypothetical protein